MITTIIFDLGEVYVRGFRGVENKLESTLRLDRKEIAPLLQGPEFLIFMEGRCDEDNFWQGILNRNGWEADIEIFKKAVRDNFTEIKGTREIIKRLKKNGYLVGLLSDHSREWIDFISTKFELHSLFDSVLFSFEAEAIKADKKIFHKMLEKLNENAANCLFIDDHQKNLDVAKSVGLETLQFIDAKQLIIDLQKLKVRI